MAPENPGPGWIAIRESVAIILETSGLLAPVAVHKLVSAWTIACCCVIKAFVARRPSSADQVSVTRIRSAGTQVYRFFSSVAAS